MLSGTMKFLCLLLVITFVAVDVTLGLGTNCTQNDDCPVKEKSVCISLLCQCDTLSKFSDILGKCLKYATEFNTLCYEDWQCEDFIGESSQCLNNACQCKTGYRWYRGKCQKYAKKDEACDDDVICLDGSNPLTLTCTDKTCQCSEGYYDRGTECRNKSLEGFECAITNDCFPTKNMFDVWSYSHCELAKCIKNTVQDVTDTREFNNTFRYSEPASYLKTLMDGNSGDTTTETPATKCSNGVSSNLTEEECQECPNTLYFKSAACICERGFFLQDGKCIAELGMQDPNTQYETDTQCPVRPGKAVDGVCYCRNYWFVDSTNRECKKTTLEFTKNCLDNDWCKAMGPYAYCDSTTEKCQCSSQAVLNETSFYCELKPDADVSKICLENAACPLYETCTDEKCQCDEGFYRINETSLCLPKIGYSCEVRDCDHIDNAICSNNEICQCDSAKDKEFVSDGFVCLETTPELNGECQIQQQCKNIPNANCLKTSTFENATSECLCADEYLDVQGICYAVKGPGSQCSTQFNCTIILGDTFECRNNLCQCPIGKTLDKQNVCASGANRLSLPSMLPIFLTVLIYLWFHYE